MTMKFFKLILKVPRENMVEKTRIYALCGNKFKLECKRLVLIYAFLTSLSKPFASRSRLPSSPPPCGGGALE